MAGAALRAARAEGWIWVTERAGSTLLIGTDPAVGLTAEHVERLEALARRHS